MTGRSRQRSRPFALIIFACCLKASKPEGVTRRGEHRVHGSTPTLRRVALFPLLDYPVFDVDCGESLGTQQDEVLGMIAEGEHWRCAAADLQTQRSSQNRNPSIPTAP